MSLMACVSVSVVDLEGGGSATKGATLSNFSSNYLQELDCLNEALQQRLAGYEKEDNKEQVRPARQMNPLLCHQYFITEENE